MRTFEGFEYENAYTREMMRIIELLKHSIPEEQIIRFTVLLEALARKNDATVKNIMEHPLVRERYDVEAYDGACLQPKPPSRMPIHFIRCGIWKLEHLDNMNIFTSDFYAKDTFDLENFLSWFAEDGRVNRVRLDRLNATGSLCLAGVPGFFTKLVARDRVKHYAVTGQKEKKEWMH